MRSLPTLRITTRLILASKRASSFDRTARNFLKKHPDLRARLTETLSHLSSDTFHSSLHLHALSGQLTGLQAISLTYRYALPLHYK